MVLFSVKGGSPVTGFYLGNGTLSSRPIVDGFTQRLMILILKFILGFILLSNMNVVTVYTSSSDEGLQLQAGVVPINFAEFTANASVMYNIKR